jgi:hypothetical protein
MASTSYAVVVVDVPDILSPSQQLFALLSSSCGETLEEEAVVTAVAQLPSIRNNIKSQTPHRSNAPCILASSIPYPTCIY